MKTKIRDLKAPINEIFFSYQGEGMFVGEPQVFVRFSGCNLRCNYCDTPGAQVLGKRPSFLSIVKIIKQVQKYARKDPRKGKPTVSLTGGEPLLYSTFLKYLLPKLKKIGAIIHLETNGTLPESLRKIIRLIDVVAMDIKLPSACGEELWGKHEEFLKMAKKKAFVKVVLSKETIDGEIKKVVELLRKNSPKVPLVLQPATPSSRCRSAEPLKIFEWTQFARKKLNHVYVMPQIHPLWKIK